MAAQGPRGDRQIIGGRMSYHEENGQVVLTMSRDDYQELMLILGASTRNFGINSVAQMASRLNEGNPKFPEEFRKFRRLLRRVLNSQEKEISISPSSTTQPTVGRDPERSRSGDGS